MILTFFAIVSVFCHFCNAENVCKGYCKEKIDCEQPEVGKCDNNLVCCKIKQLKSEKKCQEYGQYVYKQNFAPALMARSMTRNISECEIEAVPLVVGGIKAKEKEFPHMVIIGYGKDIKTAKWLCGGSLISEKFVLSAAHCSFSRASGAAKFARAGLLNLKNYDESNVQDFTILKRINHPKFKPPSRYYDISLFKLSSAVTFNGYVRPACIGTLANELKIKKATATGWGKLTYSDDFGSENLMKVSISLIDRSVCKAFFGVDVGGKSLPRGIVPSQICAGELKGGKDTCQGDSGGPLQVALNNPYCMYSIIGITSFGKFCGFKNSPAVYTRVSYFAPWIESVIWS